MTVRGEPFSILIADDDHAWRWTLQAVLEPYGYETLLAENGRRALEIIELKPVHCVLLDMHMPELSGLETLRLVRQYRQELPCILVTSDESRELREAALSLQAFSVLTKPVTRELVTVTVHQALASAYPHVESWPPQLGQW